MSTDYDRIQVAAFVSTLGNPTVSTETAGRKLTDQELKESIQKKLAERRAHKKGLGSQESVCE